MNTIELQRELSKKYDGSWRYSLGCGLGITNPASFRAERIPSEIHKELEETGGEYLKDLTKPMIAKWVNDEREERLSKGLSCRKLVVSPFALKRLKSCKYISMLMLHSNRYKGMMIEIDENRPLFGIE